MFGNYNGNIFDPPEKTMRAEVAQIIVMALKV